MRLGTVSGVTATVVEVEEVVAAAAVMVGSATASVEEEGAEEGVDGVVVRIVTGTPDGEEEAVDRDEIMVPQAEVVDEGVIRVLLHPRDTGLVLHLVVDVDLLHILVQGLLVHHHPGVP